jgi:hypothetical protein
MPGLKPNKLLKSTAGPCTSDAPLNGENRIDSNDLCLSIADLSLLAEIMNPYSGCREILVAGFEQVLKEEGSEFRTRLRESAIAKKRALRDRLAHAKPFKRGGTKRTYVQTRVLCDAAIAPANRLLRLCEAKPQLTGSLNG